jgi:hypothetical protein
VTPRTIILLSAKRTGSTALFRVFANHPEVGVCHVNQAIPNWEPNFWNLAADAIAGQPTPFRARFAESHPFLGDRAPATAHEAFEMWDAILARLGPILFDKSPAYLLSEPGLGLLMRYAQSHDVRVFGLIRDARDAISSQLDRFQGLVDGDSPAYRERLWLKRYNLLETLRAASGIPIVRYEDLAAEPDKVLRSIMAYCDLTPIPETWDHIRPVNVGRHLRPDVPGWSPSAELMAHLERFGYVPRVAAAS